MSMPVDPAPGAATGSVPAVPAAGPPLPGDAAGEPRSGTDTPAPSQGQAPPQQYWATTCAN